MEINLIFTRSLLVESGGGSGTGISHQEQLAGFGLELIRPNPVNQEALVTFRIKKPADVKVKIYNQLGQQVATLVDGHLAEGEHVRT